jgi:LysR family transcriptional regulator, benzoate and cis,cis-muconate-responsive activator of ben and cat genes
MELRHLHYFIAVAEELNVTRAAERLHISQPPLSRQIQEFEAELEVKLLDRTGRHLRLTEAGRFAYEQAKQLIARITDMQDAARRIERLGHRWLNIGFVPSTLYGLLPDVIRRFREGQPDVEVGLIDLTTVEQAEALKSGRIDVGFGRFVVNDEAIVSEIVTDEPLVAVVPVSHRLAKQRAVTLSALTAEHVILYPARPRPGYADQVIGHFRSRGLAVTSTREVNELQVALGLVAAGVGVTVVPQSVQRLRRDDVRYKVIADDGVTSPVVMMYRQGDQSLDIARLRADVQRKNVGDAHLRTSVRRARGGSRVRTGLRT